MKKIKYFLALSALLFVVFGFVAKDAPVVGLAIGNKAPEIALASPDGDTIELSSLEGKLVLIDFWASWCGPCRRENPVVVDVYNRYHDKKFVNGKGFEIYSVSLDKSKDRWKGAIKQDNLTWEYHVSDLLGWRSKAGAAYRISSIPTNYLIDENGVILAKNLRGHNLEMAIKKYLK